MYYLCIEMSWKGSISRMSDECLMKQEMVVSFYTQYQAVMRKFTLAGKTMHVFFKCITDKQTLKIHYMCIVISYRRKIALNDYLLCFLNIPTKQDIAMIGITINRSALEIYIAFLNIRVQYCPDKV